MSRFHSYILSAVKIIESYDGKKPLVFHLKSFFAAEKKYGSRDRKTIAALCYNYFRIGHALNKSAVEEKILAGLFLCEEKSNEILGLMRPEWNEQVSLPVIKKMSLLNLSSEDIFPFVCDLGNDIEQENFAVSFLSQPHLYARIRPGKQQVVISKLNNAGISFELYGDNYLKLINSTALDTVLNINKDVVIQDYNSGQVFDFLAKKPDFFSEKTKITAWDCCAASGGKTILLHDILKGDLQITVSDIRENMLHNLEKRLQQAGVNVYKKFVADLSIKSTLLPLDVFSMVVCDAPCTGSGTWSRTPEQLLYFDNKTIDIYAERQKQIVSNIIPHLQPGGLFFYITCSVFKKENEEVVAFINAKRNAGKEPLLTLLHSGYLKGYNTKADTMFVAVFTK